jgi:hypothetical protein
MIVGLKDVIRKPILASQLLLFAMIMINVPTISALMELASTTMSFAMTITYVPLNTVTANLDNVYLKPFLVMITMSVLKIIVIPTLETVFTMKNKINAMTSTFAPLILAAL